MSACAVFRSMPNMAMWSHDNNAHTPFDRSPGGPSCVSSVTAWPLRMTVNESVSPTETGFPPTPYTTSVSHGLFSLARLTQAS